MALLHQCRACLAAEPYLFLPMGDHPPANSFVRAEDLAKEQPAYPLDTQVCLECGLIQVSDRVAVLYEGAFSGIVAPDTPREEIGLLMGGQKRQEATA